jgi:hypothetical protein
MTSIQVDIHQRIHTCPAEADPHPYDTRRTILAVLPGGPCRQPVTVRSGDTTATIACGRHVPRERQCPACRVVVVEHAITTEFLGHHGPQHPHPTSGVAA